MRQSRLFSLEVSNFDEATTLKSKLEELEIKDSNDEVYKGFISCEIFEKDDCAELLLYTHLEAAEFNEILFSCSSTPKIFQFEKRET